MQIPSTGPTAAATLSWLWLVKVRQTGSSLEKAAAGGEVKKSLSIPELCVGFFSPPCEITALRSIFRDSVPYLPPHKDTCSPFSLSESFHREIRSREESCTCKAFAEWQSGFDSKSKGPLQRRFCPSRAFVAKSPLKEKTLKSLLLQRRLSCHSTLYAVGTQYSELAADPPAFLPALTHSSITFPLLLLYSEHVVTYWF